MTIASASKRSVLDVLALSALATCGLAFGSGCSSAERERAEVPPVETVDVKHDIRKSDAPRRAPASVDASIIAATSRGNRTFGLELLRALGSSSRAARTNTFISPYSIGSAVAMLHSGAVGDTVTAIDKAMNFEGTREQVSTSFGAIDASLIEGTVVNVYPTYSLSIANALWTDPSVEFKTPFLDGLATNFGSGVHLSNFRSDPEGTRKLINDWVESKTEKRIVDLLPEGAIGRETVSALVNAVHFKGKWQSTFEESATAPGTFHAASADVTVPLMHATMNAGYAKIGGKSAVVLPYEGNRLSFVAITDEAIRSAIPEVTVDEFDALVAKANAERPRIALTMPKWSVSGESLDITDALVARGMGPAVRGNGNYTDVSTSTKIGVEAIVHKTFVDVNEKGTEAAAATGVILGGATAAMPADPIEVTLDRPFLYAVIDGTTGAMLFVGELTNPK